MSFLKKLFGGGSKPDEAPIGETYEGMRIFPEPIKEGSVHRLCARIEMDVDGAVKEHRVIRADTFNNRDEAVDASTAKAKQMIDEQGKRLFN